MEIKIGCDLVHLGRFKKSLEAGGVAFLTRIFSEAELRALQSEASLAGVFAAKEATIKALGMMSGDWKQIEVIKDERGKPRLVLGSRELTGDVSISHDGEYAMATAVFLISNS